MIFKSDKKFKLPTYISLNATKKIFIVQYALMETNMCLKGEAKLKITVSLVLKLKIISEEMFGTLFL